MTTTHQVQPSTVKAPGSRLRYFTRGDGPVLLLIAGGHGDASKTDALAAHLADSHTVVTYDRRGLSGSTTGAPARSISVHADDASRILAAVTAQPAHVYGTSFGGAIALALAAAHPAQVAAAIVHEPAAMTLLPDVERAVATQDLLTVERAFAADGVGAALREFATFADIDPTDREADVIPSAPTSQQLANMAFFVTHDLPALRNHVVELGELRNATTRLVPAVGANSGHIWPHACGVRLAEGLGVAPEILPGGHNGYVFRPRETAHRLREVLNG
ncbi:alpha/beta hydrolase [Nocardioides anomalus]|uniref:Alpha/beta hydrolase n=1 Tax=Nocardioides anomalus TaxID=2712223 RepID=A0A6G6WFM3_9ACTN|nr:alpha/beta hydrolase [Nocardioides anomalus]QIG44141.1 alpha/beta hydrolase [Nocardioides anomalus]